MAAEKKRETTTNFCFLDITTQQTCRGCSLYYSGKEKKKVIVPFAFFLYNKMQHIFI